MQDRDLILKTIELSLRSVKDGGFPVGAIIAKDGKMVASGTSNGKQLKDPTSHAEIAAIRKACLELGARDLPGVVLYSSLEPCLMCLSASFWASIPKIVYACGREKVSRQHYEGSHNLRDINQACRNPIEIVHMKELESEALKVIEDWEEAL